MSFAEREPVPPDALQERERDSAPRVAPRLTVPGWGPALALIAVVALAAIHAWQQRWLCDDAFISFRYSRQLEEGYGLVFNRGERVRGNQFLWVLEMALGMKLESSPSSRASCWGGSRRFRWALRSRG